MALGDIQYFKNKIEKAVDYYINSLKIYKYNEYTLRKLYNIFKNISKKCLTFYLL